MANRTDAIRQLAATIHTLRPEWDVGGIRQILADDSRPMPELIRVAMAVANDHTARTPGVIRAKESDVAGIDPRPPSYPQPPPAREILTAPKQPDEVAHRGAELARKEIRKWKEADQW